MLARLQPVRRRQRPVRHPLPHLAAGCAMQHAPGSCSLLCCIMVLQCACIWTCSFRSYTWSSWWAVLARGALQVHCFIHLFADVLWYGCYGCKAGRRAQLQRARGAQASTCWACTAAAAVNPLSQPNTLNLQGMRTPTSARGAQASICWACAAATTARAAATGGSAATGAWWPSRCTRRPTAAAPGCPTASSACRPPRTSPSSRRSRSAAIARSSPRGRAARRCLLMDCCLLCCSAHLVY